MFQNFGDDHIVEVVIGKRHILPVSYLRAFAKFEPVPNCYNGSLARIQAVNFKALFDSELLENPSAYTNIQHFCRRSGNSRNQVLKPCAAALECFGRVTLKII